MPNNETIAKMHLSVRNVTGTVAGIDYTFFGANDSVLKTISSFIDVASTTGTLGDVFFLIAANLTTGDPIFPASPTTLNQTITLIVAGANRTLNQLKLVSGGTYVHISWDKVTGIIVKMSNNESGGWFNLTMTGTNMWRPSSGLPSTSTLLTICACVVIVIGIAGLALMRKPKRK
jgi:hypothetical protein